MLINKNKILNTVRYKKKNLYEFSPVDIRTGESMVPSNPNPYRTSLPETYEKRVRIRDRIVK